MGLRVNPNFQSEMIASLNRTRNSEDKALEQLSSGRRISTPSDDPSGTAALILTRAEYGANSQFASNISSLTSSLQVADSTLSSVVTALTRAISLATEAGNGTLTSDDRTAIAQEVTGIQQQVLSLANTEYQGNYLFAGTAINSQPFVQDAGSASGVSYKGNETINSVEVGAGQSVPTNLPGDQLFSSAQGDVFQALNDLVTALQNDTDTTTASTELQKAFASVNTQRTFYGTTLSRLNTAQTFLNNEKLQLDQTENDLIGADITAAASNFVQAESIRSATLQAAGKISQLSLLDYLR
jgi:flagellar hook-associated protein 3 FlgL